MKHESQEKQWRKEDGDDSVSQMRTNRAHECSTPDVQDSVTAEQVQEKILDTMITVPRKTILAIAPELLEKCISAIMMTRHEEHTTMAQVSDWNPNADDVIGTAEDDDNAPQMAAMLRMDEDQLERTIHRYMAAFTTGQRRSVATTCGLAHWQAPSMSTPLRSLLETDHVVQVVLSTIEPTDVWHLDRGLVSKILKWPDCKLVTEVCRFLGTAGLVGRRWITKFSLFAKLLSRLCRTTDVPVSFSDTERKAPNDARDVLGRATDNLRKSRRRTINDFKFTRKHAQRLESGEFDPGAWVLLVHETWIGALHGNKGRQRWAGPYVVHERYPSGSYSLCEIDGAVGNVAASCLQIFFYRSDPQARCTVLDEDDPRFEDVPRGRLWRTPSPFTIRTLFDADDEGCEPGLWNVVDLHFGSDSVVEHTNVVDSTSSLSSTSTTHHGTEVVLGSRLKPPPLVEGKPIPRLSFSFSLQFPTLLSTLPARLRRTGRPRRGPASRTRRAPQRRVPHLLGDQVAISK
ncbi:uncharacterized protein B0H18DRAFT_676095 [Fomitopsis serialis]|uniref:uncharacterized protein n=1 Tax=Fomitopsis serialis TaxID=139415 RepID=UPI0020074AE0|nr:uncharacterized protein B0H18DRAFT_676095 [Neoantrodia serialis]KAH9933075.1 hypothetical protein B0H18DRAFT_676095 [Neoantrodia serialis]